MLLIGAAMSDRLDNVIEKKLLKSTKQYNEDKLVMIDGTDQSGETIYREYISLIKNGYDITVDDASYFIGCSYTYFITRLVDKIYHIRINTAARKLIFLYSNLFKEDLSDIFGLITKRILLNREDFFEFMKKSIVIEQQYKVLSYNDFDNALMGVIQDNLDIYNSKHGIKDFIKTRESLINDVILAMSDKNAPVQHDLPEDYEMPEKFYSIKEIKLRWGIRHDMEAYRMLDANGARKFLLCNGDFVRYDTRDFERNPNTLSWKPKDIFKIDYKSFLSLNHRYGDAVKEIQKQALKAAKRLAEDTSKRLR